MTRTALGALILCGSALGCTLASGWTDLQGGVAGDAGELTSEQEDGGKGTAPKKDAAAPSSPDAEAGATTAVPCGAQTCSGTNANGCCIRVANQQRYCTDFTTCDPGAIYHFLRCTSGAQCGSATPSCCFTISDWSSSCQNGCSAGDRIFCDPARAAQDCSSGDQCLPYSNTPDIFTCQ